MQPKTPNTSKHFVTRLIKTLGRALLLALFAGIAFLSPAQAQTAEIRIGGTGAGLGTMQKLADAFKLIHPEVRIKVMPSLGSTGGIKAVAAGALDIGVSSRPLSANEQARGLKSLEACRNPFVIATSVKTPVDSLTDAELAAIYRGEKKTWRDGTPVRPVLRPMRDTDTAMLRAMTPELDLAVVAAHGKQGMNMALTDTDTADLLEKVPGAIGASSLALIVSENRRLKPVALNGVMPSVRTLSDNSYKHYKPLYLITHPNTSAATQRFIHFVTSQAGTGILAKNGNLVNFSR